MAPPRSQPELMEELVEEILLRLPPDEPACLVQALLVCKPWRRLLSRGAFLRRYRAFHRSPPLVGFFRNLVPIDSCRFPAFFPTTSIPSLAQPAAESIIKWALDCRHGRLLLHMCGRRERLVVWNITTGDLRDLPSFDIEDIVCSGAVFCAVDCCDHLGCNGGPFRVVFVTSSTEGEVTRAHTYSSETNSWTTPASVQTGKFSYVKWNYRGAIIGDQIYFNMCKKILKYDSGKHSLSVMTDMPDGFWGKILMLMEDGSLGIAAIRGSSLHLWSRKVSPDGVEGWIQYRSINLEKTVPKPGGGCVIGFAEGVNIIFFSNGVGTFAVELKSGRVRKVDDHGDYHTVLPFMQFYTPDFLPARTC